jgi:hypothetical protein
MYGKIIGILVCVLLIVTALSVTGAINVHNFGYVRENNDLDPFQSIHDDSPEIITIEIVAKVQYVYDPNDFLSDAIQVNDSIIGKYTYYSGQPDSNPNPQVGEYLYTLSSFGIELKAGGFVFKTNPINVEFGINIYNDWDLFYGIQDCYIVYSNENMQLSNGLLVDQIYWRLDDTLSTALSSDALPITAPELADWVQNPTTSGLYIYGQHPSNPSETYWIFAKVRRATKSRTRDVYFTAHPILNWLLEQFPNLLPILKHILVYQ